MRELSEPLAAERKDMSPEDECQAIEMAGLTGSYEPEFDTFDSTEATLESHAYPGDIAKVLTLFNPDEDGVEQPQLEIYDRAKALEVGVIEEEVPGHIEAECHSDDHAYEVSFNAAPWFQQASVEELQALKDCGWGGDYAADEVAEFMEHRDKGVSAMFTYLHTAKLPDDLSGFECYVEEDSAMAWLETHRPKVFAILVAKNEA